ncbi:MAG: biotin/lipoyl-containing protein, partial [Candidatus Rokuibacteriota bacterium]
MAVTKVVMPKLSDAMESGKIIKWLKKEGDRIQGGDILAEVETDKADVEMEAFGAGVLRKILVPAGETVAIGALIGVIAEPGDDIAALVASAPVGTAGAGSGAQKTPLRPE